MGIRTQQEYQSLLLNGTVDATVDQVTMLDALDADSMSYTLAILTNTNRVLVHKTVRQRSIWGLFGPFSPKLWVLLLAVLLV